MDVRELRSRMLEMMQMITKVSIRLMTLQIVTSVQVREAVVVMIGTARFSLLAYG